MELEGRNVRMLSRRKDLKKKPGKNEMIKEENLKAKRHAKRKVCKAKKYAEDEKFANIKQNDKYLQNGKTNHKRQHRYYW